MRERELESFLRFTSEDNVFMIMTLTQIDLKAIKTMTACLHKL